MTGRCPGWRPCSASGTTPEGERSGLDTAVRVFFEGVTAKGTTVLVFEDAHWADAALLDFIDELPEWWSGVPILVVAVAPSSPNNARPGVPIGRARSPST